MLRQLDSIVVVVVIIIFSFSIIVSSDSDPDSDSDSDGGGGGCPPSKVCPEIKYPFRAPDQPSSCGYSSGFDVQYYVNGTCYLTLPSSSSSLIDNFIIKNINYSSYRIELISNIIPAGDDDNNCLPTKLLSLKLEGTPFNYNYYKNYNLYNCSSKPQGYNQIGCSSSISNKLQVLICVDNNSFVNPAGTTDHCGFVDTVKFPITTLSSLSTEHHDCTTEKSFFLYWTAPSPPYMYSPSPASNYNNSAAIGGIVVGTFLLIVVVLPFAICVRKKIRLNGLFRRTTTRTTTTTRVSVNATGQSAAPRVLPAGHLIDLAASTTSTNTTSNANANNYPLIIIGDSGRMLVNMEDNCCPICLVDYVPQDKLMILPQCLHKFHADCLNEWLRQKSICPMCRTRPPPRTT